MSSHGFIDEDFVKLVVQLCAPQALNHMPPVIFEREALRLALNDQHCVLRISNGIFLRDRIENAGNQIVVGFMATIHMWF